MSEKSLHKYTLKTCAKIAFKQPK